MTSCEGLQCRGRFEDLKTDRRVHLVTLGLVADSQVLAIKSSNFTEVGVEDCI